MSHNDEQNAAAAAADVILTERIGEHLLLIRINRPHRRNAFDSATSRAMETVIDAYEDDPSLRCAIVTGSDGVFCAGQDLIAAAAGDLGTAPRRGGFGMMGVPPIKPIIAAVEGSALGGGLELCLACDLIVSSRTANFGLPDTPRSLVAIGGGLFRLPKRIPYHLAMEMALTGKPWPATRLAELGLVNRLAQPGRAVDCAIELAGEVIAAAPLAVVACKQIVQHAYDWDDAEGWHKQMEYAAPVLKSADLREGLAAFAEKRAPVWSGK